MIRLFSTSSVTGKLLTNLPRYIEATIAGEQISDKNQDVALAHYNQCNARLIEKAEKYQQARREYLEAKADTAAAELHVDFWRTQYRFFRHLRVDLQNLQPQLLKEKEREEKHEPEKPEF